ncbi:hypothetical protein HY639_04240 [Candidatus Woesearchaeota archaeon]|nr:hypothetical protein [Candidatus Woesearchaeota archaeon]
MKEVVIQFRKAEVANYSLDTQACDIKIAYDVDGHQRHLVRHLTKNDRDFVAISEDILVEVRRLEKHAHSTLVDDANPLSGFVNVKVINEDDVPESMARFFTKVMNQAKMNSSSSSIPRYQIRDALCKLSANL